MIAAPATCRTDDERAILGLVLVKPGRYADVACRLAAEDFGLPAHQRIWDAMTVAVEAGRAQTSRSWGHGRVRRGT